MTCQKHIPAVEECDMVLGGLADVCLTFQTIEHGGIVSLATAFVGMALHSEHPIGKPL